MTHEQIEKLKPGHEMDTLIAALMEPQPEPVSARELRDRERGDVGKGRTDKCP